MIFELCYIEAIVLIHDRHSIITSNCKILLLKFNTWEQGQIERKKGSLSPFGNATDRIFAKNFCDYGVMASPLHCNGIAITP